MNVNIPRLVIAGLSGDSGKTIVSLSLLAALGREGRKCTAFKKGPDYIDAAWLGEVAGVACRNLDTYLVEPTEVFGRFVTTARGSDMALIEGNRGLFDGKDVEGSHSTAVLAKLLRAPVVLVVDVTKMTRTAAALVKGCQVMAENVDLIGVVLNNVAGQRHRDTITEALDRYCGLPVFGTIPKLGREASLIPGRHLGLVPPAEWQGRKALEDSLAGIANRFLDLRAMFTKATEAPPLAVPGEKSVPSSAPCVRLGYFRDSVFTFYYPENLEALVQAGAELIPISSLEDRRLPAIDGLYIGGGFPETHAERLAANTPMLRLVKEAADDDMPIYTECGGLIYLCRSLRWGDRRYGMAGVFPYELEMSDRPAGHGYTEVVIDRPNPFYEVGAVIRGHEFHYSRLTAEATSTASCMAVRAGTGLGGQRDGLCYRNVLACYTHIHADGVRPWASAFVAKARQYRLNCQKADDVKSSPRDDRQQDSNARPGRRPGQDESQSASITL